MKSLFSLIDSSMQRRWQPAVCVPSPRLSRCATNCWEVWQWGGKVPCHHLELLRTTWKIWLCGFSRPQLVTDSVRLEDQSNILVTEPLDGVSWFCTRTQALLQYLSGQKQVALLLWGSIPSMMIRWRVGAGPSLVPDQPAQFHVLWVWSCSRNWWVLIQWRRWGICLRRVKAMISGRLITGQSWYLRLNNLDSWLAVGSPAGRATECWDSLWRVAPRVVKWWCPASSGVKGQSQWSLWTVWWSIVETL